jgi:hypothetical protein
VVDQEELQEELQSTIERAELEALIDYYMKREVNVSNEHAAAYAAGNATALKLIWKTLYDAEGCTLRQWVTMEGPDGVEWEE